MIASLVATLSRWVYSLLLWSLTPVYLLRLWWRGRAEPLYRTHIGERLGRYPRADRERVEPGRLWIHAVSLGETRAAAALIEEMRQLRPGLRLLLTHSTATGREAGAALLAEGDAQAWLPYDTPGAVARFMRHWRPALGVLMETEVWPNIQHQAWRLGIPMVLANARLSERSFARGQSLSALMRPAAERMGLVLAQTQDDALRLTASGAPRVEVLGNLKYDLHPSEGQQALGRVWRAHLQRQIILAAVTREGEEEALLAEFKKLSASGHRPLLLIVPRHPQRFDEVAALIRAQDLTLTRRSNVGSTPSEAQGQVDVWLGDSMREMPLYYALADVALLGGSFEPLGGQNLIEAAACACPLVMGPHTFNFAEAAELALAAGAALRVADMAQGVSLAQTLCADQERRAAMSRHALAFAAAHRGAAQRMAQHISELLNPR